MVVLHEAAQYERQKKCPGSSYLVELLLPQNVVGDYRTRYLAIQSVGQSTVHTVVQRSEETHFDDGVCWWRVVDDAGLMARVNAGFCGVWNAETSPRPLSTGLQCLLLTASDSVYVVPTFAGRVR